MERDAFMRSPDDAVMSPVKSVNPVKIREMQGSNAVNPPSKDELAAQMRERYGSPDKQQRVEKYMQSSGMKTSLASMNADPTFVAMDTKPQNRGFVPPEKLKKEVWRPKTSLQWHEPYRAPLTLQ